MSIRLPKNYDDSRLPVGLRTPLKVPHYAWHNWGISWGTPEDFDELAKMSEQGYRDEWDLTTEQGDNDIAKAAILAGYGNATLNPENARIISYIVRNLLKNRLNIADNGAGSGGTSLPIWNALEPNDRNRVHFTLVDPAKKKLEAAESKLNELGLRTGKEFDIVVCTDLEILKYIREGSQDIVTSVAAIHHHAYLGKPFGICYDITKKGGFLTIADWHNSMWEHPARVYQMLQQFDWPTKEEDLKNFVECYPKALEPIGEVGMGRDKGERIANEQIIDFWKCYAKVRTTAENQFFILEGHRPSGRYITEMQRAGYDTNSPSIQRMLQEGIIDRNPYHLQRDSRGESVSSLHMLTVGQRMI